MQRLGVLTSQAFAPVNHGRLLWCAWAVVLAVLVGVFSLLFVQAYREWGVFLEREQRYMSRLKLLESDIAHEEAYLNALLRDPVFMEHVARERLGYAKQGELLFRFKGLES